ncbi:MAG: phenylalanine--tRNA ligase subunit beta [Actinomycetota bacterium]
MRISLNWLRNYVEFDLSPEELAERLNLTGTVVEGIEYLGKDLQKVVVGRIKRIKPHPNADYLKVCSVDIGGKELQIVCGAKNMKEGDKVPVALVGTKLPSGLEINRAIIKGVVSEGMMCSESELGVGEDASGLLILDESVEVGENLAKALGLEDAVLELEITPNRPDCLGVIGIAREVAAIVGSELKKPKIKLKEVDRSIHQVTRVDVLDGDLCPRYAARIIDDITIAPSPLWMKRRLQAAGFRAINNVVDITNYVMLETGQPLHAFDFHRLNERRIVVRTAHLGETIVTLDGVFRQLDETMLVIADAKEPIALAGVMGGAHSEVSEGTTTILLESANFNPRSIMRTSRKLGLITESSNRFEKGLDPNGPVYAADRAAQLMQELAGGKVFKGVIDVYPKPKRVWSLTLRPQRVNDILGTNLLPKQIAQILESLELKISRLPTPDSRLEVRVPTFRPDLEREIDLIEEVARLYGYNRIQSTLPESGGKRGGLSLNQRISLCIKDILVSCGLWEVVTYSFIGPQHFDKLMLPADSSLRRTIALRNPLSEEQSIMRTTLLPGLLEVLRYNAHRNRYNVQIFEVGRIFHPRPGEILPHEPVMVAAALTGSWRESEWHERAKLLDFFDAKGIIETLFDQLGIEDWHLARTIRPFLHPGRGAEVFIKGEMVGILGEIHPHVQEAFELPNPVTIFELEEAKLVKYASLLRQFEEIPKYPDVTLDIALVVDEAISNEEVYKVIRRWGGRLLKEIHLFDLYRGGQIPRGKKSLAYSLTFRADDRTLTEDETKKALERIIARLKKELGARIRA